MKLKPFSFAVIVLLSSLMSIGYSQSYIAGETYFDSTGFVEYRVGNLPLIFSAPHGGDWSPDSIPDRDCAGCVYSMDSYTREIAWGIYDAFYDRTGCYPHMVINRLHRVKFDANRDIGDAADGNPLIEQAWMGYHSFIDSAKNGITQESGRGLFLDIHGHAHTIQRVELGYLLSKSELQFPDSVLNTNPFLQESSIRTLEGDNIQSFSHSELLRGQYSFGTMLDTKGFPTVPSSADPFPDSLEDYFKGGYNTARHGSRDNAGEIDAIQIELNQDIRFDAIERGMLIDSITSVAIEYIDHHYNSLFIENLCNTITGLTEDDSFEFDFKVYPNPSDRYLFVKSELADVEVHIINNIGKKVLSGKISFEGNIDVNSLPRGQYIVHFQKNGVLLGSGKMIKN